MTAPSNMPEFQIVEGDYYDDEWISERVRLRILPKQHDRKIKVLLWSPYFSAAYLRNNVSVEMDGVKVFSAPMFPCSTITIDHEVGAGEDLTLAIASEAVMRPDCFDARERSVVLKLSEG